MARRHIVVAISAALALLAAPALARPNKHQDQKTLQAAPVERCDYFVNPACLSSATASLPPAERIRTGGRGHKVWQPMGGYLAHTGGGVVRSAKTGATAHVSSNYRGAFQAYVDDLEAAGATVRFMGGYRRGHCSSGHQHPCDGGMALDVCQIARGIVDGRCHLPGRQAIAAIAARHGLFEGGQWCNNDYGHAQAGGSRACGARHYAHRTRLARQ